MPIAPLVSSYAVPYFAHGFQVVFHIGGGLNIHPKLPNLQNNRLFCTCFLQSIKKIWDKIEQIFFYHHQEQEKLFNLVTNFMQIGPSKAEKY